jgi:hypothetical protein
MITIFGAARFERILCVSVMIGRFTVKLYSSMCGILNPDILENLLVKQRLF